MAIGLDKLIRTLPSLPELMIVSAGLDVAGLAAAGDRATLASSRPSIGGASWRRFSSVTPGVPPTNRTSPSNAKHWQHWASPRSGSTSTTTDWQQPRTTRTARGMEARTAIPRARTRATSLAFRPRCTRQLSGTARSERPAGGGFNSVKRRCQLPRSNDRRRPPPTSLSAG